MATKGYEVSVKEKDNLFVIKGKKDGSIESSAECEVCEVMSDEEIPM